MRPTTASLPYGSYDVVVGLDLKTARSGHVIAPAVSLVEVNRDLTRPAPIRLVPAIRQQLPKPGGLVSEPASLRWASYPGAIYYAVSITVVDEGAAGRPKHVGQACWARSGIATNSTS